jgi:integration host factor subunit alpha
MSLIKADMINTLYRDIGISKKKSTQVIESLIAIIKESLEHGEDVMISGFGKLWVKEKKERRGRNPQTTHAMMLGARRVVRFKCSERLKAKINGKGYERGRSF